MVEVPNIAGYGFRKRRIEGKKMFRMPEDTYRACQRFRRKKNYRKAYQCLETLLRQFPVDEGLMVDIVELWGRRKVM
jgi:hypothetical protein